MPIYPDSDSDNYQIDFTGEKRADVEKLMNMFWRDILSPVIVNSSMRSEEFPYQQEHMRQVRERGQDADLVEIKLLIPKWMLVKEHERASLSVRHKAMLVTFAMGYGGEAARVDLEDFSSTLGQTNDMINTYANQLMTMQMERFKIVVSVEPGMDPKFHVELPTLKHEDNKIVISHFDLNEYAHSHVFTPLGKFKVNDCFNVIYTYLDKVKEFLKPEQHNFFLVKEVEDDLNEILAVMDKSIEGR